MIRKRGPEDNPLAAVLSTRQRQLLLLLSTSAGWVAMLALRRSPLLAADGDLSSLSGAPGYEVRALLLAPEEAHRRELRVPTRSFFADCALY